MKSTHIPEFSGDIVEVTGELTVDTELRALQSAGAVLAQDSTATEAGVSVECLDPKPAGGHVKLTLKTWAADGATPGVNPVKVAWTALGL